MLLRPQNRQVRDAGAGAELVKVAPGATGSKINVNCDALILDERSSSDTILYILEMEGSVG